MSCHANVDSRPARRAHAVGAMLLAGLCAIGAGTAAQADERRSTFTVGATVAGVARVVDTGAPGRLVIDAADVAAGFVEVQPAAALQVDSNSRAGFAIEIRARHPAFADVEVRYGGGIARLNGDTLRLVQRGRADAALPLAYRFNLPRGLPAGSYDWPLEVRASTL